MKTSKQLTCIGLGVVFWLGAALFIRFTGESVFSENNPNLFLWFVLVFPISYGFILITTKVAQLRQSEVYQPVVIMTTTATFLDGLALSWFGQLYGQTAEVRLYGAAWILWGVGAGLFLGQVLARRNTVQSQSQNTEQLTHQKEKLPLT